ncbi:MAG: tetratricopeptide repeat protein [Thermodesulfobacteriota bacterium]
MKKNGFMRYIVFPALALIMTLPACASVSQRAEDPDAERAWTCDEDADRALMEDDLEAGIRLHEEFLESHPDNALALYHLGYAYGRIEDHEREIACYERAQALGYTDGDFLFNLGMAYGETGATEKAVKTIQMAVDEEPDNADYRVGLGLALERSGKIYAAAGALEEAVRLDPMLPDARWFLVRIYVETDRLEPARVHLQDLLEIDPDHPQARGLLQELEAMD